MSNCSVQGGETVGSDWRICSMQAWAACKVVHGDVCARVRTFGICLGCSEETADCSCARDSSKNVADRGWRHQ